MMTIKPLPSLPPFFDMKYTEESGRLTVNAQLYNDLSNQILSKVVEYFNNGIPVAPATTAQITAYGTDTTVALGTIWFNTSIAKLQVKTAASTIETISSS